MLMDISRSISKRIWLQAGLLGTLLLILAWLSLSSLIFFTNDTGLRLLQIFELIENRWQSFAVSYPARFLDPELAHTPFYYAYLVIRDQIFLSISALFPLIASVLYSLLGRVGLIVLPVAGTVASAMGIAYLVRLGRAGLPVLALWVTALGTPLLFYSLELWDHSFVTAFAVWAVYLLARGYTDRNLALIFFGGALAAVAWSQRPEFAFLTAGLGLSLLVFAPSRLRASLAFAAGNLLALAPIWLAQMLWFGHPLGVVYASQLFDYGVPLQYAYEPYSDGPELTRSFVVGRMLTYVQSRDPVTFGATLLGLAAVVLVVFALRVPRWRKRAVLLSGLLLSVCSYLLWLIPMTREAVTGILPTFPLLPLSLAVVDDESGEARSHGVYRFVLLTTVFFLGAMLLMFPSFGGSQWGSRYFLPAYPLLTFLAFYAYGRYRQTLPERLRTPLRWLFTGLVVTSIIIQFAGVRVLFEIHEQQRLVRDGLEALPAELILTNSPFLPSQMSSLQDKMFLYVNSEEDFQTIVPAMMRNGIERMAVVRVQGLPLNVPATVGAVRLTEVQPLIYELSQE